MKYSPRQNYLGNSLPEIEQQVEKLLIAAEVKDRLPTPVDDVIQCCKLIEVGAIDLEQYKINWLKKGFNYIGSALKKIQGLIDFKSKIVYVTPDIHPSKRTFVKFHEVTHKILPWQAGIYNPHCDTEYSLRKDVEDIFDAQANVGASMIQFQLGRFASDISDIGIGLGSAIKLAQKYGTSYHSTLWKYVEDNPKVCALLIIKYNIGDDFCELCYPIQSVKFSKKYGSPDWPRLYCKGHPIFKAVESSIQMDVVKDEMYAKDIFDFKDTWSIEVFSNSYFYFVLVYQKPLIKLRRAPIVKKQSIVYV